MTDRLQTIATFNSPIDANLARNRLESAGIQAVIIDQETVGTLWHMSNAFDGIKLQVPESAVEEAVALLDQAGGEGQGHPPFSDEEQDGQLAPPDEFGSGEPADDETPDSESTAREQNADRIWRGSLLGILFGPLQLYVLWLVIKVLVSRERLDAVRRRRAILGAGVSLASLSLWFLVLATSWPGAIPRVASQNDAIQGRSAAAIQHFWLGQRDYQKGDLDSAFFHFSHAIAGDPAYAEAYVYRGDIYADKGEIQSAIGEFTRAIEIDPIVDGGYVGRAAAHRKLGNLREAITDLDEGIKRFPENANLYHERARAHEEAGNGELAFADFDEAIRLNPSRGTYMARGQAYLDQNDWSRTVEDCNAALRLEGEYRTLFSLRGLAHSGMGEIDLAISDFSQAIKLDPRSDSDFVRRGIAYMNKGDPKLALSDFDRASEIAPHKGRIYVERAAARRALGDVPGAERDEQEALRRGEE